MSAIELDGAYNVRDLGGLPTEGGSQTRYGLLYRGDSLDAISPHDQDTLFHQLGIGVVVDLRTRPEVAPAAWRDGSVQYYQFPLISERKMGTEPFPVGQPEDLGRLYMSNLEDGQEPVRATLEVLAEHLSKGTPCIVGCAAGRDRTGVIMAVLLSMLGVTDDAIAQDYSESNRHAAEVALRLASNPLYANGQPPTGYEAIAVPEAMLAFLRLLRERFSSARQFALDAGLRPEQVDQLRAALIEPATDESMQDSALVL
ncbi:MAG TPA: tyrosine-protein phosphatase [Streptosporangiaceae bacterium]|nr:tyrosine-protein phosphatase [Streptosporangiaceae bacterium]